MSIKLFLKPDWRKVAITVIIFVLLFFIPIFPTSAALPTPVGMKGGFVAVGWESLYSELSDGYGTLADRIIYMELPIIINFFISYLISCLIFWFYGKKRKH